MLEARTGTQIYLRLAGLSPNSYSAMPHARETTTLEALPRPTSSSMPSRVLSEPHLQGPLRLFALIWLDGNKYVNSTSLLPSPNFQRQIRKGVLTQTTGSILHN